jgi:putative membrane protein
LIESAVRLLTLFFRVFLFLLLLGFAVKNSETVSVRYLMGLEWHAPLSLILLVAFALGVMFGLFGCSRHLLKLRRDVARLRREAAADGPVKQS